MGLVAYDPRLVNKEEARSALNNAPVIQDEKRGFTLVARSIMTAIHSIIMDPPSEVAHWKGRNVALYIGRSYAVNDPLYSRWFSSKHSLRVTMQKYNLGKKLCAAVAVVRAPINFMHGQNWEKWAQVVVRQRILHNALCVSEVDFSFRHMGVGKIPKDFDVRLRADRNKNTDYGIIYIGLRIKPGRVVSVKKLGKSNIEKLASQLSEETSSNNAPRLSLAQAKNIHHYAEFNLRDSPQKYRVTSFAHL